MKRHLSVYWSVWAALTWLTPAAIELQAQQSFSPGLLKLEVYRDIEGNMIDDLRADPKYPSFPDEVHYVTRFEIPPSKYVAGNSGGIHVGEKLSGYLVPDQTANYVFYVSANENGELWLSENAADATALELIATGSADYPARTYDTNTPSSVIHLEAGKRYYLEALVKESGKEESLAVAWTKENEPPPVFGADPISGHFLGILTQPDSIAPAAISNLAIEAESIGNSYLWLKWTAPGDSGNTDAVAHYDIRYSTAPMTLDNWASAAPAETTFFFPSTPGASEAFKVEKLSPDTMYYLAVRAQDAAGNVAALSNIAQGRTKAVAAGDIAVVWDLEFDKAGEDPTSKGDWKHRTANQTSFDPATQVADGVLKAHSFNPTLDSAPKDNFTDDFIVQLRMRCLSTVGQDTMYDGVVFWVNLDTVDQKQARVAVALQLLDDNTQRLNLVNKDTIVTNFTGLSTDFQDIQLEFQPALKKVLVKINGQDQGAFTYVQQETTDSRFATILSWNAEGEFDYVRIGRPVRQMDARWNLTFDTPGIDPTAKGDWKHRTPGQTSFDPATQVVGGVLKTTSFNPTLDTTPKDDFTYPFITEVQMRCVTPVTGDNIYGGAVFWINMDTTNGTHAAMTAALQLRDDGTQVLNIINNGTVITNYTGLSTDFHTVRLEVDPPNKKFHVYLDGSDAGVLAYEKKAMNDDRYATILSWDADGEFKFARIGTPITASPVAPPQMRITRSGGGLIISWPIAAAGYNLESSLSLVPANWMAVADSPVVVGDQNTVTIVASGNSRFLRLKK